MLEGRVTVFGAVGYTSFLIPGLVMMSVLQNAFANRAVADPEQDHRQPGVPAGRAALPLGWFAAYVGASVVRGVAVGTGVMLATVWFAPLHLANPL
jgi:ABC-2 type transport system permease protein